MTAVLTAEPVAITEPGVYDIPNDAYHADPVPEGSLSTSGARMLLPPNCPAKFAYEREHGRPPKDDFDFGHAAHLLVLGAGQELVVVDADNWRTKAARETKAAAHADGKTPILACDLPIAEEMAAAVHAHPIAGALFQPGTGRPEQSLFWRDRPTGIWRRARLDWLPNPGAGRMILPDYKTAKSADREKLQKPLRDYGYDMQAAGYTEGVRALGLATDIVYLLVVQEKTPPYLVNVLQPDDIAMRVGAHLNREAIDIYQRCIQAGRWPGYSDDVQLLSLPPYIENRYMEEIE